MGITPEGAEKGFLWMWWAHMLTVLGFMAYLPSSKHAHLLASPFGVFLADLRAGNPWETQAKVVALLAEAARAENPKFDFRFWGAIHYEGKHLEKMTRAARGYSSLISAWTASDRTIMVPDAAVLDPGFLFSQRIAEERGIPLYLV